MTLIYRAVWEDDWVNPPALLEDEFRQWCAEKGIDQDDLPRRGRYEHSSDVWVDVRRADVEIGRALQCTLSERDPRGRTWTTTATAMADNTGASDAPGSAGGNRTLWVDIDCEDPSGRPPGMAAPRLVRGLIDNGGRPTIYGHQVRTDAKRLHHTNISELTEALLDPDRSIPIVVFSPDTRSAPPVTIERADTAAATLVGLVHVYTVSPTGCDALNRALPDGFGVYGGAVRLYLPHLQADDPDDALRHRWTALRIIADHPRRAASLLARRLVRLEIHQPIPSSWNRLGDLLRRPSESAVIDRAAEITASRTVTTNAEAPTELRQEIEDLTSLLAEADLIREASEQQMRDDIGRLQALVEQAEEERLDDADELDELRRENDALRRTISLVARGDQGADSQTVEPDDPGVPESISEAVTFAERYLPNVVIPAGALVDVDELDTAEKYYVWASATWRGLQALNDYAQCKADGNQPAGFKLWCESTGAWPASKLAMTESETVLNNDRLRGQRHFPVDTKVDRTGRIHMFAHLKIQAGGGNSIPRLYFHDDCDGATGKMHIGFIGPHRHVRNTKS